MKQLPLPLPLPIFLTQISHVYQKPIETTYIILLATSDFLSFYGGLHKWRIPNMVGFIRENRTQMDDGTGVPPLPETSIYIQWRFTQKSSMIGIFHEINHPAVRLGYPHGELETTISLPMFKIPQGHSPLLDSWPLPGQLVVQEETHNRLPIQHRWMGRAIVMKD